MLKMGQKVKVKKSHRDGAWNSVKQFSGRTSVVIGIHRCKLGYYYALMGIKSKYGKPYYFVEDWLIPVED